VTGPPAPDPGAGTDLELAAADGFRLAATLFEPGGRGAPAEAPPVRAAAVVASALGVRRRLYEAFAADLAAHGFTVLIFDYRGVGGSRPASLRGFEASMHEWGELDLDAAIRWLSDRCPGLPLAVVGHSAGGQVFGLAPAGERVGALLGIAAQNGHWRYWEGWRKLWVLFFWYVLAPLGIALFGYLPMARITGGQDVPAGVGREWIRWGRHRDYVLSYARPAGRDRGYREFDRPLAAWGFADDHGFAPPPAVARLPDFYPAARGEVRIFRPAELGARQIGHFGCFRERFRESLWRQMREWLEGALGLAAL
jgi:predicted alpha/beta hydrolase